MNTRTVLYIVSANLILLLILAVLLPQHMVQPGRVMEAHRALEADCFACHAPFLGSRPERCIRCHKPAEIGLVSTTGVPIGSDEKLVPFHQGLIEKDCVACHGDHKGVQAFYPIARFSHALLQAGVAQRCASCHRRPVDDLHCQIAGNCGQCHTQAAWTPATFSHDRLEPRLRGRCETCHRRPGDKLHRQVGGNCGQCHTKKGWRPAAFNHNRFFRLDGHHRAACTTCHRDNDFTRYTCYGCHAHSPGAVRAEHREEGIVQYANCVKCHRSGASQEREHEGHDRREGDEGDDD